MGMCDFGGMFAAGGACLCIAAAAFVGAVVYARGFDRRGGVAAGAFGVLSAVVGAVLLYLGSTHPGFNIRQNQGFPSDWSCSTQVGRHVVCARDDAGPPAEFPLHR